jgi:hypothetical protein
MQVQADVTSTMIILSGEYATIAKPVLNANS